MSSRVWLLVEWVDERNVFPSYGVVNVNTLSYGETDLCPGNVIYVRVSHENPRRAKILRMSESKRYVKEHKEILERQDQQVKNVLQLCMRTIKDMKSGNSNVHYLTQQSSNHGALPHVVVASKVDSASDSESELEHVERRPQQKNLKNSVTKYSLQYNGKGSRTSQIHNSLNTSQYRRRSMASSTPLPSSSIQKPVTLYFDQGTQTEGLFLQPSRAKIEEMETVLKNLYERFQYLVSQVNGNSNGSTSMSESEHHDEASYVEPNNGEPWPERNVTEHDVQGNAIIPDPVQDVGAEQVIEENSGDQSVDNAVKVEDRQNPLRVRRMSAQTTNNVETFSTIDTDLVPIGNGNTKVPARLLNDINWNSHTSATRQLLQAVFPRRVLATHSLTGKQSPAFMNRPPKKILDPKLVEDIVKIVSTRCNVPKNLVRNSITIKCTDEAKLYRNRMQYKLHRKTHNDENRPPSTPSSDESTNNVVN